MTTIYSMDIETFIIDFKEQLIDGDEVTIESSTKFRDLGSWDSLTGMVVLLMISEKYTPAFTVNELKNCKTIQDIYDAITQLK